jgi:hypothetical protein
LLQGPACPAGMQQQCATSDVAHCCRVAYEAQYVLDCFHMLKSIIVLLILFFIGISGVYFDWYGMVWWLDVILHFSGGFFVAMFFWHYFEDYIARGSWFKNLIIITGATLLIGVLWEFAEYIANQTLVDLIYEKYQIRTYFMGDIKDTMADLMLDILGALTLLTVHSLRGRNAHKS